MTRLPLRLALALVGGLLAATAGRPAPAHAEGCAFPFTPTSYEDLKDRKLFTDTIELAAFNMLFPDDPYFGLPDLEFGPRNARQTEAGKIPTVLLKAIGWIESSITQAAGDVPFGSIGPALVSFDCGHGVAQVTSGMTVPAGEDGRGSPEQALVASHFAYNIARGAFILADKWNDAPEKRPIVGLDTNGHPGVIENWYYAVWSYNGFTGPGANRSNHPMDPIYGSWPRSPYSCAGTGDGKGHNRGNYPYQELVFGCAASPPVVDGDPLWQAQEISLPDLDSGVFEQALDLDNFIFPYVNMDIPTPQPFHVDAAEVPDGDLREAILGSPRLEISHERIKIGVAPESGATVELVNIFNQGSGVLAWYATPTEPWLKVLPYAGVAVGEELPCERDAPCNRVGRISITVDASQAPPGARTASIRVQALGTDQSMIIEVEISKVIRLGVPGVTRH